MDTVRALEGTQELAEAEGGVRMRDSTQMIRGPPVTVMV